MGDQRGPRQVEAMAAYGVTEADIVRVLGIDPKTLRKHYRDELDIGSIKANSRIAESLYRKAMVDGAQSVTACIFWLKTRAQSKETILQGHKRDVGPIIRIERVIVPSPLSHVGDRRLAIPHADEPRMIEHVREN